MAAVADTQEISKSAKRRAAKKARDAAFEESQAPAPPAPAAPKAVPKAKASTTKAEVLTPSQQPKAKAKATAKAPAKAEAPPAPAADPKKSSAKSSAKAKAKPKAEPEAQPKAESKKSAVKAEPVTAPAAEPKQAAKAKAQPKASTAKAGAKKPVKVEEEEKPKEKVEIVQPFEIDDGRSGGWETTTGLSKKSQKRQEKLAYEKELQKASGLPANQKAIPGMGPSPGQHIPGMAPPKASQADINAVLAKAAAAGVDARKAVEAELAKESNQSTATIKVPEGKVGIVIGPKGSKIKLIQEKTGAKIDTSGEVFTVIGEPSAVSLAEAAIRELIEKGYCSMEFEDFKEEFVQVHPSCFPDLIGKGGVTIKAMKSEVGVEVKMPDVPKTSNNDRSSKKYRVTLAGKKENVEKAKEVINHICMYGYHEATHSGQSHQEIEVPAWAYSFLIGKAGSELKHIQNNYKVKVNIPREHSACQNVVVVGEKHDVERAQTYIEKLLWNAENQSKGRDRQDGATDHWGDEEDEEDWMKAYLYKR